MTPPDDLGSFDPAEVVRTGYDSVSHLYRADDAGSAQYAPWLSELAARLPAQASVLDIGCGCGVPVSRDLDRRGHRVVGIDLSDVQIQRARRLVPDAQFVRADVTHVQFADETFDAVLAFYSVIHVPLTDSHCCSQTSGAGCVPAAGSWALWAGGSGPAANRSGWAATRPCGGATPTSRRIGAG